VIRNPFVPLPPVIKPAHPCDSVPTISARELVAVIAALRLWQVRNLPPWRVSAFDRAALEAIAHSEGPALDTEEIDRLCRRLGGLGQ
jgi:hypothetical protein